MSEEKKICTVVIVDDEESIRTLVQATLEGPDCRVGFRSPHKAGSPPDAEVRATRMGAVLGSTVIG